MNPVLTSALVLSQLNEIMEIRNRFKSEGCSEEVVKKLNEALVVYAQNLISVLESETKSVKMKGVLTETEATKLVRNMVGQKIPVIKMYRERTGAGLAEAKVAIEKWLVDNKYGYYLRQPEIVNGVVRDSGQIQLY